MSWKLEHIAPWRLSSPHLEVHFVFQSVSNVSLHGVFMNAHHAGKHIGLEHELYDYAAQCLRWKTVSIRRSGAA